MGRKGGFIAVGDPGELLSGWVYGNSSAMFTGDLIDAAADGYCNQAAADAGISVLGVAQYFVDSNGLRTNYLAASQTTNRKCKVYYHKAKACAWRVPTYTGTDMTQTLVHALVDHVATAGSTTTGESAMTVNLATADSTSQMRIVGIWESPGNTAWDYTGTDSQEVIVEFVESAAQSTTAIS